MVRPRLRRGARGGAHPDAGQATVELALVLPVVVLLLMAVFQVAVVARDQVLTVQAARAAVREAAVDAGAAGCEAAARDVLDGAVVDVDGARRDRRTGRRRRALPVAHEPAARRRAVPGSADGARRDADGSGDAERTSAAR